MAAFVPLSKDSISRIHGVGPAKLAEFGDVFLALLRIHARENNLDEKSIPVGGTSLYHRSLRAGPTHFETKRLLDDGLSIAEVAQRRGLTETTITGHLERLVADGERLELSHLVPPPERLAAIERAIQASAGHLLTPVKERLGDGYSYDEIRLVEMWLRQSGGPRTRAGGTE